ncbi:MAG: 5'/3'-nucleotidase SurE [Gammaproteobacteria bacterium]|nr:5'/3'-nucleotidase SurE [Gammaproteobacteria bacterium]
MKILISNDDGYQSEGIAILSKSLADMAEIFVVAPDRDRSGASNSLTLDYPLRARQISEGVMCVDGTPTDCVHLAITGLLDDEPDIVVSGINAGANLGDDVLYSGTVAAATEGRFLGLPAMAISLVTDGNKTHYDTAGRVARDLLQRLLEQPLPVDTILNVNVPNRPWSELSGFKVTRLGNRHKAEPVVREHDPRGKPIYWVGPPGKEADAGAGTDFHAVKEGFVSITPIHTDLTQHDAIHILNTWVER